MSIALTGSSGMLGSSFSSFFKKNGIKYFSVSRKFYTPDTLIDVVIEYFSSRKTKIIIHCAANTNVELCEKNKEQCFHDNYKLTEVLTKVSKNLNIKLVFISSTGVYGNYKTEPYTEKDKTIPPTNYHRAKLNSEKIIKFFLEDYIIIRTGWLFGGNLKSPKNFVVNRILEAKNSNGKIYSNIDQNGNPTYTNDLVKTVYKLIKINTKGLFNCVNEGFASRYEYVSEILKIFNYPTIVEPVSKSLFSRVANVSNNEMALNMSLLKIDQNHMPNWKSSLKKYILDYKI